MALVPELPDPGARGRRYTARPFPAYRYVPGVHPHPTRDPLGHSYQPEPTLNRHPSWRPEDWQTLERWLYGVDLFNAFYFWEAHEAWEPLWAAADSVSVQALTVQGLIQIAGALLKTHVGSAAGAYLLSTEGLDKLRHVATKEPKFMGLDLPSVVAAFETYFSPLSSNAPPRLVDLPLVRLGDP